MAHRSGGGLILSATNPAPAPASKRPTTLIAYFSRPGENYHYGDRRTLEVGNTDVLARMIAARIDCDLYRIKAVEPYAEHYDPTVARNVREEEADARPAIAGELPDISQYDTVLLGSPVWNVQTPMIMRTFVEALDFRGKTIYPFVTYAVSGLGRVIADYRAAAPDARIGEGLAVQGETVSDAAAQVAQWIERIGS